MNFICNLTMKSAEQGYPFIPLVNNTPRFVFDNPITVLCGDNGCGKTTFAKILATVTDCVYVSYNQKPSEQFLAVYDNFVVSRRATPRRKFYFSAEEFVQFVRDTEERKADAVKAIKEIQADQTMSDYAKRLACSPHYETLDGFESFYGGSLAEVSHGQGFLAFFDKRLGRDGLYIIDEPEAALSGENQFLLASRIYHAAKEMNCQFVVCTHSPVVAAIPGADVYEVRDDEFCKTTWEELSNVSFMQMFFKNKDRLF